MSSDRKLYELFEDKSVSDVYKNIYENSERTRKEINSLVNQLKPMVKNLEAAIIVVPLIREYMEILVKNDEHLIKLVDSVTRLLKEGKGGDEDEFSILTEKEKRDLLKKNTDEYEENIKEENEHKKNVDERVEEIKQEFFDKIEDDEKVEKK